MHSRHTLGFEGRSTRRFLHACWLVGLIVLAGFAGPGWASTIRSDLTTEDSAELGVSYSNTVGAVYGTGDDGSWIGSGTIVGFDDTGTWILTAAHVVQDATSLSFKIDGTSYAADSWAAYSTIADDSSNIVDANVGDVALVHLSSVVSDGVAATLYTGDTSSLLGTTATFTGYGNTGDGSGYQDGTYGSLHAVQNTLDATAQSYWGSSYSSSVLLSDFDEPAADGDDGGDDGNDDDGSWSDGPHNGQPEFPGNGGGDHNNGWNGGPDNPMDGPGDSHNDDHGRQDHGWYNPHQRGRSHGMDVFMVFGVLNDFRDDDSELSSDDSDSNVLGDADALEYEGLIAPGDSGGGVFVTIDDVEYLVGVNSFLSCTDGECDADYGDVSGIVSVADYYDWIVAQGVDFSAGAANIPEPVTATLMFSGGLFLALRRRRR